MDEELEQAINEEVTPVMAKELPGPLFQIGDKVRMKQEILDELDREGTWAFHEGLKHRILTVSGCLVDAANWVDYYVVESPFILAEKWLEAAE